MKDVTHLTGPHVTCADVLPARRWRVPAGGSLTAWGRRRRADVSVGSTAASGVANVLNSSKYILLNHDERYLFQ